PAGSAGSAKPVAHRVRVHTELFRCHRYLAVLQECRHGVGDPVMVLGIVPVQPGEGAGLGVSTEEALGTGGEHRGELVLAAAHTTDPAAAPHGRRHLIGSVSGP